MPSPNMQSFLQRLNVDPEVQMAFDRRPDQVMASFGLSADEQALLRSPDRYRTLQATHGERPTPNRSSH